MREDSSLPYGPNLKADIGFSIENVYTNKPSLNNLISPTLKYLISIVIFIFLVKCRFQYKILHFSKINSVNNSPDEMNTTRLIRKNNNIYNSMDTPSDSATSSKWLTLLLFTGIMHISVISWGTTIVFIFFPLTENNREKQIWNNYFEYQNFELLWEWNERKHIMKWNIVVLEARETSEGEK